MDEPDLQLGGFQLWIHGWEFPDLHDYWDGNWLNVTARMEAGGARVESNGPFLRNSEFLEFLDAVRNLNETLKGSAELSGLEPDLKVLLEGDGIGRVAITVDLTPDQLTQQHNFKFAVDQTYLRPLIAALEALLEKWPIRGSPEKLS